MDWDDMRIFLSVAREESLSGAARRLRLDPATVGRRIARLEAAIDAPLFMKSPTGYVPTEAAERLMAHAETVETALREATEEVAGQTRSLTGTIRIGAPDGCATFLLPQVVRRIARENPGLEVQIIALPRVFNLSKREADMAIAVSRPQSGRLTVQKIADYGLRLAGAAAYLESSPPIRSRDDLAGHPIVGYIPDLIFDAELDYLAEAGIRRVDVASNLVSVQHALIRAGAGLGIVHDFAMAASPDLVEVLAPDVRLKRTFWLIRHADDRKVDRLNRFARLLAEELRAEIDRLSPDA
jgi:DNA-binding transcriptional LysR family regulator